MLFQSLAIFLSAVTALALSSPPSGAITVGNGGKYSTLSKALADTSSSTCTSVSNTYEMETRGNLKISSTREHTRSKFWSLGPILRFTGRRTPPVTTLEIVCSSLSWHILTKPHARSAVTLTFNANAQAAGGDDPSGTLRVHADNVSLYNVNVGK
jgi:pectinesterase